MEMYCKQHKYHRHHHHEYSRRSPSTMSSTSSDDSLYGLSTIQVFTRMADEIKANKSYLQRRFPKKVWYPSINEIEWCSFTLGFGICSEIYGENNVRERTSFEKLPYRKPPLLSIVVHLPQGIVKHVLHFLHKWFLIKGMKNLMCLWIFAMLSVLEKDYIYDMRFENLLENLYKDCELGLTTCEEWQKPRITLIMNILEDHFDISLSDTDSE